MIRLIVAALLMLPPLAAHAESAREIVISGVRAVFIEPDVDAIKRIFSKDYIQHNPMFPNGPDVLIGFVENRPDNFKYEVGAVIADEGQGLVAVHFRTEGFGPKPLIGVDIFRVEDGLIVEHWDVVQEEAGQTVSGNPMWGPALDLR